MAQNRPTWTTGQLEEAVRILGRYRWGQVAAAVAEVERVTGRELKAKHLADTFKRHGMRSPASYLGAGATRDAVPPPPPSEPPITERAPSTPASPPDVGELLEERAGERERKRLRAERDALLDQLQAAHARTRFQDAIREPTVPIVERRERASGLREGALVVMASDWHVEERVEAQAIAGVNSYDLAISEARSERFFSGIEWLLAFERQAFKLRDVVLWLGGDFYSGYIHEDNVETSELSPVESVLFVKRLLTTGIRRLLADPLLERLVVPCSYGNHGRTTEKRRVSTGAQNSFEWLLYQVMADEFRGDPRVSFTADQSAHQYVQAFDETLHFTHGDELKYGGGVGGLAIPLGKRLPKWDQVRRAAVHHIGHFHQFTDLGRCVVNGSLIGFNAYAQSIGASLEPAQQAAYVFDSKRGKCLVTPIWVGE